MFRYMNVALFDIRFPGSYAIIGGNDIKDSAA
jgi:hypothetical protein